MAVILPCPSQVRFSAQSNTAISNVAVAMPHFSQRVDHLCYSRSCKQADIDVRRFRSEKEMLQELGYTEVCRGCEVKRASLQGNREHTEACRKRIKEAIEGTLRGRRAIERQEERINQGMAGEVKKAEIEVRVREAEVMEDKQIHYNAPAFLPIADSAGPSISSQSAHCARPTNPYRPRSALRSHWSGARSVGPAKKLQAADWLRQKQP